MDVELRSVRVAVPSLLSQRVSHQLCVCMCVCVCVCVGGGGGGGGGGGRSIISVKHSNSSQLALVLDSPHAPTKIYQGKARAWNKITSSNKQGEAWVTLDETSPIMNSSVSKVSVPQMVSRATAGIRVS